MRGEEKGWDLTGGLKPGGWCREHGEVVKV